MGSHGSCTWIMVTAVRRGPRRRCSVRLASRRSPPGWTATPESPDALWARLFVEYGGASLPDVSLVPDGTAQSVYWIDGSTISRVSRDGAWDYSVSEESEPGTVPGGVLSSDVLSRDGAPHGLSPGPATSSVGPV